MPFIRLTAILFAFLALSSISLAQSQNPAWLEELGFAMEAEKECEVAYYLNIQEGQLGAQPTYSARVQCVDGRQYDAERIGEYSDFEIRECEVQAC